MPAPFPHLRGLHIPHRTPPGTVLSDSPTAPEYRRFLPKVTGTANLIFTYSGVTYDPEGKVLTFQDLQVERRTDTSDSSVIASMETFAIDIR